ncbi:SDR family oxidoreductase [Amycolatopsis sp. NPDC023774]|uniref:SDR family NAD(P)-dependent oxidoreductase n=1 Tax=Amycolatopsis sp. NPDC023774 TaxID=3155015 RepID=UPI0033D70484
MLVSGRDAERAAGGGLHILVDNAALLIFPSSTADLVEELIDAAHAVNVEAPMLLTGLLAPGMAARGSGAIVNLGSINGLDGMADQALECVRPMLATIPSRRASTPEEIANAVLFLPSDDALNILGTTLSVDGGYSAVRSA